MLECWDRKNKEYVAIKIVRNVQKYRDAAMIEVRWHFLCLPLPNLAIHDRHRHARQVPGTVLAYCEEGPRKLSVWRCHKNICSPRCY